MTTRWLQREDAEAAARLWREFGDALGLESLRRAYGEDWPRPPVPGELVWSLHTTEECLPQPTGWCALRRDPVEPIAWMMLGVWPAAQRGDYGRWMRRQLVAEAAALPGVDYLASAVAVANADYLASIRRIVTPPWAEVGALAIPSPGWVYFARPLRRPA